jgi:CheY-like chemotaxis protein
MLKGEPGHQRDTGAHTVNTAFTAGTQTNRALEAGASEILHKPLDLLKLREVLSGYLPVEDATIKALAR